ncbi:MAG: hypothetical protein NC124_16245, partial [Clostridium sp.]|nr:hypothetical protein [Clostridium sp.]
DVSKNLTRRFLQEWAHMKEILEPVSESAKSDEEKKPADYAFTKELLHLLKCAIEEMDVDTADEIMQQLKRFSYPEIIMSEVLEKLSLAVANLDEEQTAVWVDKFEQELKEDKQ